MLGAILLDNSSLELLTEKLKPEEFFLDQHRRIYERMTQLASGGSVVDTLTLSDHLQHSGELEAVGGIIYLSNLIDGVPKITNVEHYAKLIREKAALRQIIHTCHSIQEASFEETEEPSKIIASADALLSQIDIQWDEGDGVSLREASQECLANFEKGIGIRAFTGIPQLDDETGGAREGEVWIIAAKTGVGKSNLSDQVMRVSCRAGLHALYCSGEMFAHHLASRGLATDAEVDHWKMRRPEHLNTDDKMRLADAALRQCDVCTILDGELSTSRIRVAARRKHKKGELQLVVIDYDELVDAPGSTDLERQINVTKAAKRMAMQFAIPVIMVSQLNKNLQQGEMVTLERLYGSGRKTKDASYVLYLDRPWVQKLEGDETDAKIFILKARDGRMAMIPCKFNLKTLRHDGNPFEDAWRNATNLDSTSPQSRPRTALESQERPPRQASQQDLGIVDDPEPPDDLESS